jgi:hypothetical protein
MKTILFIFFFAILTNIYGQNNQTLDSLSKVLEKIYYDDQVPRQKVISLENEFGYSSKEVSKQEEFIQKMDSLNAIKVSEIIDKYGWLGPDQISDTANRTIFLVIQHADEKTQLKYLDTLKNAAKAGKAKPSDYSLLLDRTNLKQGKFQEYGSQLFTFGVSGHTVFSPIRDEPNVNKRRQAVGLSSLEEYSKFFNVPYTLPKRDAYKNCYVLTGYVLGVGNTPLQNVSIYLGKKLKTKTDEYGFYLIAIKKKIKTSKINYCKVGYTDAVYILEKEGEKDIYEKYMGLFEKKACP